MSCSMADIMAVINKLPYARAKVFIIDYRALLSNPCKVSQEALYVDVQAMLNHLHGEPSFTEQPEELIHNYANVDDLIDESEIPF